MQPDLKTLPQSFFKGDDLSFDKTWSDADTTAGDTAHMEAASKDAVFAIDGTGNPDGSYTFNADSATTAAYTDGEYAVRFYVKKGGTSPTFTLETSRITVRPAYTAPVDDRSHDEKVLDAIEYVIENGRAKDDTGSFTISTGTGSRSLGRLSWQELIQAREIYTARVKLAKRRQRIKEGKGHRGQIKARFS